MGRTFGGPPPQPSAGARKKGYGGFGGVYWGQEDEDQREMWGFGQGDEGGARSRETVGSENGVGVGPRECRVGARGFRGDNQWVEGWVV